MSQLTLYQQATYLMRELVESLLQLSKRTKNFYSPPDLIWKEDDSSDLLLGGLGQYAGSALPVNRRKDAWLARSAVSFSIEHAATGVLYLRLQPFIIKMIETTFAETNGFLNVSAEYIRNNAHFLPVIMHAAGIFSKQELKRIVGSINDTHISRPASRRLAEYLSNLGPEAFAQPEQIQERMKATTEGIVRDLVGKLLLEEFVASALRDAGVPFRRESEYKSLAGVLYDFRADYVVPNEVEPLAFLEVRKSSSRHASLYAKDKMFSAINWKGRHPNCLGIIVVDGPWTNTSIDIMGNVFDYVVPIGRAAEVAQTIRRYLDGDRTVLRWLIEFRIKMYEP